MGDTHEAESASVPLPAMAWPAVLAVAGAVALTHGLVATRYGWHRDEFYYLANSRRLDWGYPDHPPLTPLITRLVSLLDEGALWPLRAAVITVQAGSIVMGAVLARELGGGQRAQVLAAGAVAGCAVMVGASLFLGTTPIGQLFWLLIIWALLRAMRLRTTTAWVWLGVVAGVALENKHTVVLLLIGIATMLAVRHRDLLRTPGPWIAAGIAFVLVLPNIIWNATHGWAAVEFARVIAADEGGVVAAVLRLPVVLILLPGPLLLFLWMRGVQGAFAGEGRADGVALVIIAGTVLGVSILAGGKPYYPSPSVVPLFALGAVTCEHIERKKPRSANATSVFVAASAVAAPLFALPYLPPLALSGFREISREPLETYGWDRFARQTAAAAESAPDAVAVFTSNYGEAGALERYGRAEGLRLPIVTGHNAHGEWGPPPGTPTEVIAVGEFRTADLQRWWDDVQLIGQFRLPKGIENEETDEGAAFYRCSGPKGSWADMWSSIRHLS